MTTHISDAADSKPRLADGHAQQAGHVAEDRDACEQLVPTQFQAVFRQIADQCAQFAATPIGMRLGGTLLLHKCYPIIAEVCGEDGSPWDDGAPNLQEWIGGILFAATCIDHPATACFDEYMLSHDGERSFEIGRGELSGSAAVASIAEWSGIPETSVADRGLTILTGLGLLPFDPRDLATLNA